MFDFCNKHKKGVSMVSVRHFICNTLFLMCLSSMAYGETKKANVVFQAWLADQEVFTDCDLRDMQSCLNQDLRI